MSVHVIYYQDGAKKMRPIQTEEEFRSLRNTTQQQSLVAKARQGDAAAKRKLLQFNYSCLPNEDGSLKGSTLLSSSVGMDIDLSDTENSLEMQNHAIRLNILAHKDDVGLLLLEHSVTKGYHLVFKRHPELTQEQNLRWASTLLGIRYDEGAKDHTRVFFATTAEPDDLIHVSSELFDNTTEYAAASPAGTTESVSSSESSSSFSFSSSSYPSDYDGIPYTTLVESLADQLGGVPVHGSRNQFLFSMACHLRYVCNDDPQWIRLVLPTYGEDADRLFRTIQSACNRAQSRNIPDIVHRAISIARSRTSLNSQPSTFNLQTPPEMPKKLPKLIQLLVSKVDPMYRPAVAMAVFPALGAHLHGVRVRYIDNSENDLGGFLSVLLAKQSIGKGSVNMPIECIMEDIRERDQYNRDLEKQWKQNCKSSKANEKKPARPEGLCIQYLMSNMTNAALVQRLVDANEAGARFLYVKVEELEQLDQIKATGGATASELIRLCFTQSLYGQERVGSDSVTGTPPLRFNFNASSTVPTGQAYFAKGLTNGTLSRLTFATIIKPAGYHGIPRFGNYDEAFKRQLSSYITNLNAATGLIECREAERMAETFRQRNEELAELSDDDEFETLSYRANRIVYDKAMLLYIADGYQWSKAIADFCDWSEQYDLWCKMHFFGQQMRETTQQQVTVSLPGVQNMLELLPDRFTREDLIAVRRAQGRDGNVAHAIAVWVNRGYIIQDPATLEYIKTDLYKQKHSAK